LKSSGYRKTCQPAWGVFGPFGQSVPRIIPLTRAHTGDHNSGRSGEGNAPPPQPPAGASRGALPNCPASRRLVTAPIT
jgi:hypothetical protein